MRKRTRFSLIAIATLMSVVGAHPSHAAIRCDVPTDSHCEDWLTRWDSGLNETPRGAFPEEANDSVASADGALVFITGESFDGARDSDVVTIAFDATDGTVVWERRYGGRGTSGEYDAGNSIELSPDGEQVFVAGRQNSDQEGRSDFLVIAYDADSGKKLWATSGRKGSASAASLVVAPDGERLFAVGGSQAKGEKRNFVAVAYDAASGEKLWERQYDGPVNGNDHASDAVMDPSGTKLFLTGSSQATAGRGNYDYATVAYSIGRTARKLWVLRTHEDARGYAGGSYLAMPTDEALFLSGSHTRFDTLNTYATETLRIDPETGREVWTQQESVTSAGSLGAPVLAADPAGTRVYLSDLPDPASAGQPLFSKRFLTKAYDADTGAELWSSAYEALGAASTWMT